MRRQIGLLDYQIAVESGSLDSLGEIARAVAPAHRYAIISDETVFPLYGDRVRASLSGAGADTVVATLPAGEQHKTRDHWGALTDQLLAAGCGRDTTIIALGGGVVGDMAGFVAATFMRGVPFIQVPTTLLAMVDASIGGKTGVDTPHGKNLVGAFHQPRAVVIDPLVLGSLPAVERLMGLAEVVKHGVIADAVHVAHAVSAAPRVVWTAEADDDVAALIARSAEIKASVVAQDERESGLRHILNFGHTIGHALETASRFMMPHGKAVSIGMVVESEIAVRCGVAEKGLPDELRLALAEIPLPTRLTAELGSIDELVGYLKVDKKSRGGRLAFALPTRVGAMSGGDRGWTIEVDAEVVREVLAELRR